VQLELLFSGGLTAEEAMTAPVRNRCHRQWEMGSWSNKVGRHGAFVMFTATSPPSDSFPQRMVLY